MDTGPEELRLARRVLYHVQEAIKKNEGDEKFQEALRNLEEKAQQLVDHLTEVFHG